MPDTPFASASQTDGASSDPSLERPAGTRYAPPAPAHPDFDAFVQTIGALRAPDGCPWDKEQTHESIAHNMIEEAYEAVDAIEASDTAHLREELGDVLLQVVLQSQIAADAGEFTIDEVCRDVNEKMIRRHPHVFGDVEAADANAVLDVWDQVKLAEKDEKDASALTAGLDRTRLLDAVPTSFPSLMQAQKISKKAAAAGFEWETVDDVWEKVFEEIGELKAAYATAPKSANGKIDESADPARKAAAELELGDVLFTIVNVARRMGLDAESSLRATCGKFRRRWEVVEDGAWAEGKKAQDLSMEELEAHWARAKREERGE